MSEMAKGILAMASSIFECTNRKVVSVELGPKEYGELRWDLGRCARLEPVAGAGGCIELYGIKVTQMADDGARFVVETARAKGE